MSAETERLIALRADLYAALNYGAVSPTANAVMRDFDSFVAAAEDRIAQAEVDTDRKVSADVRARLEVAEAEREGLRDVFEAARRLVGLREGCTYDAVVSGLQALKPTAMDDGVFV